MLCFLCCISSFFAVTSTKGLIASFLGFLEDQGLYHADSAQRDTRMLHLYFRKKRTFEKKRKPQCKSCPGLLCGPLFRHHAWRWDREMKNEIPVTLSFLRRLRMERDGRLMTCVIMTNTASAAERSVH